MNKKNNQFLLENFKKWMAGQASEHIDDCTKCKRSFVGLTVESKIEADHLIKKINVEDGIPEEIIEDFIENGGQVVDVDSKNFLIEVESGSFYVHRCYVRKF